MEIEVERVSGTPMPWWHWLIIGTTVFMGASAYLLIIITVR